MSFEQIVVDVTNNAGVIQGAGPLYNIISVEITEVLDSAGSVSVNVPSHDDRAIALLSASNVRVVPKIVGTTLKTGIVHSFSLVNNGLQFQATGPDLMGELTYLSCGYDRVYDDKDVRTVIIGATGTAASLLESTGWTQGTVEDFGLTTIKFDAETRLRALIMVGEQLGRHIRQGSTEQTLDFGLFGVDSGFRIFNVDGFRPGMEDDALTGWLGQVPTLTSTTADVFNRIFPLGKDRFDMRDATAASTDILVVENGGPSGVATTVAGVVAAADTTVTVAGAAGFEEGREIWIGDAADWTNDHEVAVVEGIVGAVITIIGSFDNGYAIGQDVLQAPQFYVEDAASQGVHGVREACPQFGWIAPVELTGDIAFQEEAASALYAASKAYLERYKDEYASYSLPSVLNLPDALRVGQKVRLKYTGVIGVLGGEIFMSIDDDFYVMKITRKYMANGSRSASLDIANVSRPAPNNTSLVLFNMDSNRWVGLG